MEIGISLPTVGPASEPEFLADLARHAEALGFASVWVTDHVLMPRELRSEYPYPASTTGMYMTAGIDWLDPVASMGFLSGVTERVRIGTSILVLPYRNPVVLANELATLDRLSAGRIDLGIGVGWMDEEFSSIGVPRGERGARADESVEVLRTLWSAPEPVAFDGRFWSFSDVQLASRPVQPGGPPILVGGNTEPALRRAGRLGDGWLGFEVFVEDVERCLATVRGHREEAGRDGPFLASVRRGIVPPFEVSDFTPDRRCIGGSTEAALAELRDYDRAGVDLVVLDFAMIPPEMRATMDWLASDVLPALSAP